MEVLETFFHRLYAEGNGFRFKKLFKLHFLILNIFLSFSPSALKDFITSVLADQCINRVEFQTWQQTGRSTLSTEITDAEDFAEQICERLLKLKPHFFTAKQVVFLQKP